MQGLYACAIKFSCAKLSFVTTEQFLLKFGLFFTLKVLKYSKKRKQAENQKNQGKRSISKQKMEVSLAR